VSESDSKTEEGQVAEEEKPQYRRVVLKLSGESLAPTGERGSQMDEVVQIASEVHSAQKLGCEIAVVIGGGNILRGAQFKGTSASIQEATAHYIAELCHEHKVSASRIAHGVPVGGELELVDGTTLSHSLLGRQKI